MRIYICHIVFLLTALTFISCKKDNNLNNSKKSYSDTTEKLVEEFAREEPVQPENYEGLYVEAMSYHALDNEMIGFVSVDNGGSYGVLSIEQPGEYDVIYIRVFNFGNETITIESVSISDEDNFILLHEYDDGSIAVDKHINFWIYHVPIANEDHTTTIDIVTNTNENYSFTIIEKACDPRPCYEHSCLPEGHCLLFCY